MKFIFAFHRMTKKKSIKTKTCHCMKIKRRAWRGFDPIRANVT